MLHAIEERLHAEPRRMCGMSASPALLRATHMPHRRTNAGREMNGMAEGERAGIREVGSQRHAAAQQIRVRCMFSIVVHRSHGMDSTQVRAG